jgi:predicted dehydrogenase
MGYAYEIHGTKGAIRFDQEDQNAIWLYKSKDNPEKQGFKKILTGPHHPDYEPFCQGPGHGTGYQDQIIIEARDFLKAIETNSEIWPSFKDGLEVSNVVAACHKSSKSKKWVDVDAV